MRRILVFCMLLASQIFVSGIANAQCQNWSAAATLVTAATCASNGAFSVSLSGADVANLSQIQYGMPTAANGFGLPLNGDSVFTGIPPGTYQVSVVATCGGNLVGRNATISVPGSYVAPTMSVDRLNSRASLNCMSSGTAVIQITGGFGPYTVNMLTYPASYTGPTSKSAAFPLIFFDQLPPGAYTYQAVDGCQSGTIPKRDTVASLDPANAPISAGDPTVVTCDSIRVPMAAISPLSLPWSFYANDTGFKVSVQISGGVLSATPAVQLRSAAVGVKLPAGKTIKDLYGKLITYTITPPCGPAFSFSTPISAPQLTSSILPNCNTSFKLSLGLAFVCPPVTYVVTNTATNVTYSSAQMQAGIPFGNYSVSYVTGDGYSGTGVVNASAPASNPYSVNVISGAEGLNNFIAGFAFTTSAGTSGGSRIVELFSGPAGYSFLGNWGGISGYTVLGNQSPTASTLKFPAGAYVWKITDACGVYYLPITVNATDLYQFTVGLPPPQLSCQGMVIIPSGTATSNGIGKPVGFAMLLNGLPVITYGTFGARWLVYPLGTPIVLTTPGTYTIIPTAGANALGLAGFYNPGSFTLGYPNIYQSSYTFTYAPQPLVVDVNNTQGFLCKGAGPGQGRIFAAGKGGVPFYAPATHYKYYLATPGNALNGPYIDSNTTGIFTGFGGNANSLYDLKVVDTCDAFVVQRIKILDLGVSRLISSSSYVSCIGGQIQLSAIYLPGATYSWTGPAGFTSSLRQPSLNATPANAGVYRVTITTSQCNQPVSDSTTLVIRGNPPKPVLSYQCMPRPVVVSVTNPSPGLIYKWDIGRVLLSSPGLTYSPLLQQVSDTPWSKQVMYTGSYKAVAIDTVLGCSTVSDSLMFTGSPATPVNATIYSPHLQVCAGDTTVLVARGQGSAIAVSYQWLLNGVPIPGATSISYGAYQSGSYEVIIDAGLCAKDTSPPAVVTILPYPTAAITPSSVRICQGASATLQATTGTGYSYTWFRNNNTIPGAFSSAVSVSQAGNYNVVISNGGCVAIAPSVAVSVVQPPNVSISPGGLRSFCPGDSLRLTTPSDPDYIYRWERNGVTIPGATSSVYDAKQPGSYHVSVATSICPFTTSPATTLVLLPTKVSLGPDTSDCNLPPNLQLTLSVDSLFSTIRWSNGSFAPRFTVSSPGTYWVTASNKCGTFRDTMRVYSVADFLPGLPDDTLICNQAMSVKLSVNPLLANPEWSDGTKGYTTTIDTPGVYSVVGQSPCGPLHDTVNVRFCKPAIRDLNITADSLCEGDCLTATAYIENQPRHYYWMFEGGNPATSDNQSPGTVCYAAAGVYTITLIASNIGGADTAHATVVVSERPIPRFKDTLVIAPYKSAVSLPACAGAQRADWYQNDSLICSNCPELKLNAQYYYNQYKCVVSNGQCPDSCRYVLRVIDIPHDMWLPDAFTPNNDGRNDIFRVITDNPNIRVVNLDVYNRWGQRVFTSNMNNGGWDGTLAGRSAEAGTYFWQIRYKVLGADEVYFRKGDILLLR